MLAKLPDRPGHILFVVGEYPPMVGGVGAYTAMLGAALVQRGWQVSVLTHVDAQALDDAERIADESAIKVYPIISKWNWHLLSTVTQLAKDIGATLIHVQFQIDSFDTHPVICIAPLWWRICGIPVTLTYHDLNNPSVYRRLRKLRRISRLRILDPWTRDLSARLANGVISTNYGESLHWKKLTRHLAVIPIGSNISGHRFSPEERRMRRARWGFGDQHVVIGYFGFVNETKGVLDLLKAVDQLRHEDDFVRLFMIGQSMRDPLNNWEGRYVKMVHEYIDETGLAEWITATGHGEDDEVSADLDACDVMVFLYQDGASTRRGTLLAGLAHGCAIVTTTPQSPLVELVDGQDVLFVPIGDVDAALAAIRRIVYDPAFKAKLRQNALAVSDTFSWEGIAAAHERFFLGK